MWISDLSIRRPVFATMVIMSFMVLGVVSLTRLGIDLFPEVNFPFVNINVVYPGASPEEVETLVTRPIEDAVAGINGVKRVVSSSTESFSRVGLELRLEVDPQAAAAEVREKVAAIRNRLPEQIEDPTIVRFDVAALPIMAFAVRREIVPRNPVNEAATLKKPRHVPRRSPPSRPRRSAMPPAPRALRKVGSGHAPVRSRI